MSQKYFDNYLLSLKIYVREAEKCEDKKLYLAASVMYGSALEAVLSLFCLIQIDEADITPPLDKQLRYAKLSELTEALSDHEIISKKDVYFITRIRHLLHPYQYNKRIQTRKFKITKKEFFVLKNSFYRIRDKLLKAI